MNAPWLSMVFAASLGLLLVVVLFAYASGDRANASADDLKRTILVQRELANALTLLVDAETGERGFIVTGDDQFLDPYQRAIAGFPTRIQSIRTLTSDNPRQSQNLENLSRLANEALADMRDTIELRRARGADAAKAKTAAGRGKGIMDQTRAVLATMNDEENRRFLARDAEANLAQSRSVFLLALASAMSLLTVIIASIVIMTRVVSPARRDALAAPARSSIRSKRYSLCAAVLTLLAGLASLAGVLPGGPVRGNTAIGFVLASAALALLNPETRSLRTVIGRVLGVVVFVLGVFTLLEYLFQIDPGFDLLLYATPADDPANPFPSRMSPATAFCFTCIGFALISLDAWKESAGRPPEAATIGATVAASLGLIGHLFQAESLYQIGAYSSMGVNAGLTFLLLCSGIFAARPDFGLTSLVSRDSLGSMLARRLLVMSVVAPVTIGWLRVKGVEAGLYDESFGVALFVMAMITVFVVLIWWTANSLDRADIVRKRAEDALRESEGRLRLAQQVARIGTFEWNIQSGVNQWTPELEAMYGLPIGGFTGTSEAWQSLIFQEDRARTAQRIAEAMDSGRFSGEWRVVWPDGSVHWLTGMAWLFKDDAGNPLRLLGVNIDITERKRAEESIAADLRAMNLLHDVGSRLGTEQKIDSCLDAIVGAAVAISGASKGNFQLFDPASGVLKLAAQRGFSKQFCDYFSTVDATHGSACGEAMRSAERVIVEDITKSSIFSRDFTLRVLLDADVRAVQSTPVVSSSGKLLGILSTHFKEPHRAGERELRLVDLLARQAANYLERQRSDEALREAHEQLEIHAANLDRLVERRTARLNEMMTDLEAFSYSIVHDMRAPLRAMQGFAELLLMESEQISSSANGFARRIKASAKRMDRLIQDGLNYSRMMRQELPLTAIDAAACLRGIVDTYPGFQRPDAEVEIEGEWPLVLANEAALTQCMSGLVSNAVKFVAPGVRPHVKVWAEERNGQSTPMVRLFFKDNGIGIEKSVHEEIFQIFQRLDKQYEGTAIGLAVVKKAAERMGGSVGVESEPGKGSTFWLDLASATNPHGKGRT